uniref:Mediator complex subunit 1 n=1 Tax=Setaria digitata TaxID=48799 RepID=A0A915PRT2_9BILA
MEKESIVERQEQKPVVDGVQRTKYSLDDFSLEEVEEEIRLGKIRQTSLKFSWDYLSQLLRRNLMEKRFVLSADDKEDLIQAAADMRKHMPSDSDRDLSTHLRHLSENLSSDFQSHPGYFKIRNSDFSLEITASPDGQQITSCSVSWFGERTVEAQALRLYISRNRWDLVHAALAAMFHLVPSDLSRDEKIFCLRSLDCAEKDLLNMSGSAPSIFEQINSGILGLCKPRTESTPFTIYPFIEPVIFLDTTSGGIISPTEEEVFFLTASLFGKKKKIEKLRFVILFEKKLMQVPRDPYHIWLYLNLYFDSLQVPCSSKYFYSQEWRNAVSGRQLPAAFCLRFSRPIIFSSVAIKKLSKIASVQLNVEGSYNLYQYLLNESEECHDLFVRLPGCSTQHYIFDKSMTCSHEDGILRQIPFAHLQDVVFIVNIIRTQLAHNAFFESLVRAHSRSASVDENIVDIHIASSYIDCFDLQFYLKKNLFMARVAVSPSNINVSLECVINGAVLPESQHATTILTKSWSLAVMMRSVLRRGGAISLAALEKPFVMNENVDNNCDVKMSQSWLFVPNITDNSINYKIEHEYVVDERINVNCSRDSSSLGRQSPLSLLALFKELEKIEELIPPQKPMNGAQQCTAPPRNEMLAPRTSRIHSENTMTINAFSVLGSSYVAIMKWSGLVETHNFCILMLTHNYISPKVIRNHLLDAHRVAACAKIGKERVPSQRLRPQIPSQSPSPASERYRASQATSFSQLSPLDIARQRLAQQAPMTNPTDVFEFDDPPRMTSTSSMGSSAQQFHFPDTGQSPYPFAAMQSTRGSLNAQPTLKRRGRGRKAGNLGDRMLDPARPILDQNTGLMFRGMNIPTRKPRGTSTARRPRRPRKAAHMPASPAHSHQFAMNRPMLQRSFSEMPTYPSQMQPVSLSQENRSEASEFDGTEESSDDETDPPPPACTTTIPQPPAQLTSVNNPVAQTTAVGNLSSTSSMVNKSSSLTATSSLSSVSSSGATTELITPSSSSPTANSNTSLHSTTLLAHKARKGSLEAVVGKLHCKTAPASSSSSSTSNPYLASDLYDDESEPVSKPSEPVPPKRDSPSISTSSPGARMSPNMTKMNPEQPGYGSELKIMIKLKQQASARPSTGLSQSSSGGVPSLAHFMSMRLVGQPPSSSRSKEEKALLRQKQMKEKNRSGPDERARKAGKRERKGELSGSSKKVKLDRPLSEQKTTTTVSPKVEFPQALAFASLKNFKIPKVMENEKCESPTPTTTTTPAVATPSSSSVHLNVGQNSSSSTVQTVSSASLSAAAATPTTTAPSSSSSIGTSSIFPPKPKSILKSPADPPPPPLFRGMGGMPPMLPGRRPLLPDPRNVMHHPPRNQFRPLVTLPRMIPSVLGGANFMPPPSSSGRWMALAPQRQPSPRNSPSEQSTPGSALSDAAAAMSKMQDSPTEGLKIVADDE